MNKTLKSVLIGIIVAFLMVAIPAVIILLPVFWERSIYYVIYIGMYIHLLFGIIYVIFKNISESKRGYVVSFFSSIFIFASCWTAISIIFFTDDWYTSLTTAVALVFALIGILDYELFALVGKELKLIFNKNNLEIQSKDSILKGIIWVSIVSLIMNIIPWIDIRWYPYLFILGFNASVMALINIVKRAQKKWIPIVSFVGINVVLVPLNIWLYPVILSMIVR